MPKQHDLGGQPAGPIDMNDEEAPPFGKMFTGVLTALRERDLITIDEMRRTMEDLPNDLYALPYYERWGEGMYRLLEEKGLLKRNEIDARMALLKSQHQKVSSGE